MVILIGLIIDALHEETVRAREREDAECERARELAMSACRPCVHPAVRPEVIKHLLGSSQ